MGLIRWLVCVSGRGIDICVRQLLMILITTGRIPTDTKQETRIYPLPHTYVVKDLVPDLTQFYKQYKSIKPYLQRETKSEDARPVSYSFSPFFHTH